MRKIWIIAILLTCLGNLLKAQDVKYAPGKVTKGTRVSYKAFLSEKSSFFLYVTNVSCQDTAILTTYYKNGTPVKEDEQGVASMDFSLSDVRAVIHEVFTEEELRNYRLTSPGMIFAVRFDQEGKVTDIFFVFVYNPQKNYYDPLLAVSPDKLYELEKRLKQIIKLKKDEYLAKYKNFKTIFTVKFFEEDE